MHKFTKGSARAKKYLRVHSAPNEQIFTRKVVNIYERHIYGSCWPLNHLWTSSQHDLTLISEGNLNERLVKD
jgi:hypothetical protein